MIMKEKETMGANNQTVEIVTYFSDTYDVDGLDDIWSLVKDAATAGNSVMFLKMEEVEHISGGDMHEGCIVVYKGDGDRAAIIEALAADIGEEEED